MYIYIYIYSFCELKVGQMVYLSDRRAASNTVLCWTRRLNIFSLSTEGFATWNELAMTLKSVV